MKTFVDSFGKYDEARLGTDVWERLGTGMVATAVDRLQPSIAQATEKVLNSPEMREQLARASQDVFRRNMGAIMTTIAAVSVFGLGLFFLTRK